MQIRVFSAGYRTQLQLFTQNHTNSAPLQGNKSYGVRYFYKMTQKAQIAAIQSAT